MASAPDSAWRCCSSHHVDEPPWHLGGVEEAHGDAGQAVGLCIAVDDYMRWAAGFLTTGVSGSEGSGWHVLSQMFFGIRLRTSESDHREASSSRFAILVFAKNRQKTGLSSRVLLVGVRRGGRVLQTRVALVRRQFITPSTFGGAEHHRRHSANASGMDV